MSKFNDFAKAQGELSKTNAVSTSAGNVGLPEKKKKETKEQMSIMLTPTQKKKLRRMADDLDMSASELIGYWIDHN